MEFQITTDGSSERVAIILKRASSRGTNMRTVMDKIAADMMLTEEKVFASQGRRGGGSWKKLKRDTVRKKGSTEILRTRAARAGYSKFPADSLFKSLTEPDAPYQVLRVTRQSIAFGTDRPFADVVAESRPFIKFIPSDINRWNTMIAEHLMAPFIEGEK